MKKSLPTKEGFLVFKRKIFEQQIARYCCAGNGQNLRRIGIDAANLHKQSQQSGIDAV